MPGALLLLALALASWLVRRNRELAREAQRIARHHRALKSANSRLQDESEQLRQQATNDALTGALNRRAFAASLREVAAHLAHYHRPLNLVVIDLDHFKAINDQLGHLAGDRALKLVTGVVREHLVSDDLFGRFGGDEFLIACADQELEATARMADTLRTAAQAAASRQAPALGALTLSIGIAQANPETGYSVDALFARADAALYEAKHRGRNRVVVADAATPSPPVGTGTGRHL